MPETSTGPALRVLVIDDDPVLRELLDVLLGFAGHEVSLAESGDAALDLLGREVYDLVLTDLHLPGLQGAELASRLLEVRPAGTLLLGMSGSEPSEAERNLLDEFLYKPFTPEQFDNAVAAARQRQQAGRTGAIRPASPVVTQDLEAGILDEAIFACMAAMMPPEQLRSLYLMTIDDVLGRVVRMQASLQTGDFDAIGREAHAIKGGCGMVGAIEIYALAAATETEAEPLALRLGDFAPACDRLKRMLEERLDTTS